MKSGLLQILGVILFLGLFGNSLYGQDPGKLSLEQLEAIAMQPAKHHEATDSRVVPEMLALFKEEEIVYTGKDRYKEETLRFRLHVPETMEPDKKYPLILWLHGTGEAGTDNRAQLIHLHHIITYLVGPKKRDFFLLVPQTPQEHTGWDAYENYRYVVSPKEETAERVAQPKRQKKSNWLGNALGIQPKRAPVLVKEDQQHDILMEYQAEAFEDSPLGFSFAMLDAVIEKYPVDTDRITVSGLSSGGDGTWRALERAPERFAAAVPLVSWSALKDKEIQANPVLKKIPIWAIYSSDDRGIEEARKDFERVELAGCNVKKSEFGVCGHNAWTPAMLQADIFSWLLSRAKKDGEYIAVYDANVSPDDMQGVVEVATRSSGTPVLAETLDDARPQPVQDLVTATTVPAQPDLGPNVSMLPEPPVAKSVSRPKQDRLMSQKQIASPELYESINHLNLLLLQQYAKRKDAQGVERILTKLPPMFRVQALRLLIASDQSGLSGPQLEAWIDSLADLDLTQPSETTSDPMSVETENIHEDDDLLSENLPGMKIVEECDRPWAMTSESLYGMFPADWDREAKKIPDFIVKLSTEQLRAVLRESLDGDGKRFAEACQSVLALENKPMSSPWFETFGGRLRSDIRYRLSGKGAMFIQLLREDGAKHELATKTFRKIKLILESK